jgi:hypothetical protein
MTRCGGTGRRLGRQGMIEVEELRRAAALWPLAGARIRCYSGETDSAKGTGLRRPEDRRMTHRDDSGTWARVDPVRITGPTGRAEGRGVVFVVLFRDGRALSPTHRRRRSRECEWWARRKSRARAR